MGNCFSKCLVWRLHDIILLRHICFCCISKTGPTGAAAYTFCKRCFSSSGSRQSWASYWQNTVSGECKQQISTHTVQSIFTFSDNDKARDITTEHFLVAERKAALIIEHSALDVKTCICTISLMQLSRYLHTYICWLCLSSHTCFMLIWNNIGKHCQTLWSLW